MAGWTVVDEGVLEAPSSWTVEDYELVQSSNIRTVNSPLDPGTFAWTLDSSWTDYYVKARVMSEDNDWIGVMFRYVDANNYYRFSMREEFIDRHWRLVKVESGAATILDEKSGEDNGYTSGNNYEVEIRANGSSLEVYLDREKILEATDSTFVSGGIALYSWANAGSYFDNVIVARMDNDCDGDSTPDVNDPDDDADGYGDYIEAIMGTDPLDAASKPDTIYINFGPKWSERPVLWGPQGTEDYDTDRGYGWQ